MWIDARIPVRFLDRPPMPQAGAALVVAAGSEQAGNGWAAVLELPPLAHPVACACCKPAWTVSLLGLFQARARGEVRFFRVMVACLPQADAELLRALLTADPALSGCFALAL